MCNTNHHIVYDNVLLGLTPAELLNPTALQLLRIHPYGDECCRIECHDGPPQLKVGATRWPITPNVGTILAELRVEAVVA